MQWSALVTRGFVQDGLMSKAASFSFTLPDPAADNFISPQLMIEPHVQPLPADARRSLLIYNALFPFVFLALLPGLFLRMTRRGNYRAKFGQRFGLYSAADRKRFGEGEWLWLHSISVGETLLAMKLAREIHALAPAQRIALSVTTSTGFAVAQQHACDWLEVIYNPLDMPWIVRRALALVRPSRLIFIEAVWPNLLAGARRRGIPVAFVPRLSPRSESRFRRFRALTGPIFRLVNVLAAPEPEDIARWTSLGVLEDRIQITGNPKFDYSAGAGGRIAEFRAFLHRCGVPDEAPIFLAGSTFAGEERIVAEVFRQLRPDFPDLFLIIVPRHAERTQAVLADLRPLGLRIARRSAAPESGADALIVDTTGELRDWYSLATVVFIGKSLTSTGGQNPVEAVMAGKPVVFGPHMENFAPIVGRWLAAGAAIEVPDASGLRQQTARLLRDSQLRADLASRARKIASIHECATLRTAQVALGASPTGPTSPTPNDQ
jgi:3-deoxy-D-manno-octulosonic-acid transferase